MKILLDENIPIKLKGLFTENNVHTIADMGWRGIQNGDLIKLLKEQNFDIFITGDKNLIYQQNLKSYDFTIFVLDAFNNTAEALELFIPEIESKLASGSYQVGDTNILRIT